MSSTPLVASLFVSHERPAASAGKVALLNQPLKVPEVVISGKLSPTARASPVAVTAKVPP